MIKEALAVGTNITVTITPDKGLLPGTELGVIIKNSITIIIVIATLAVLVMLLLGAFEWIISGGDKEKVANARNRITHALIGMAILGLAFVIVKVVGGMVGVDIFSSMSLPSLDYKP